MDLCVHEINQDDCEECWADLAMDIEAEALDALWQQEDTYGEDTWDEDVIEEISLADMYRVLSDEVSDDFYGYDEY